ncbi:glycosyl transferase family 90-domain-containing protein [Mycena maculata]|uniref:Glycosyl transferase family 90-domain-containing protein n=1 Tax=Mycena maculata TaxID=230809 RepID=A0AAD7J891_9AGAR|nr:glycosyl transferase family 90-domain-containing protein [Mycena maculata]
MNGLISRARSPVYTLLASQPNGRYRDVKFTRRRWIMAAGLVTALAVVAVVSHWKSSLATLTPTHTHNVVDELFARQSQTLEQAAARYILRNDRAPPRNYDKWFRFAKSRGCLIDEYDQIHRDFEPFYQLARDDPAFFGRMVDRGSQLAIAEDMGMKTFKVVNGEISMTDQRGSSYNDGWMAMLQNISALLPDMNIVVNHRDEPRVAFNPRDPHARSGALDASDAMPFRNAPHPTSKYYKDERHCIVPNEPKGFMTYANDANSFLLYSASADFATDLYPVLSQSKIYPCFSDILFPSEFHYTRSYWSPKYGFPDNVPWEEKKATLYWRGQSTGGWISGTNYHAFPRFKLLDIARGHGDIMDVAISAFYEWFCQLDGCDAAAIKAEYNITGAAAPREEGYGYKYVFDVDGNSFSGRYLGLLKSGSLVFKSTLFTEYFDGWLQPFVHYIPVLPDLSDLVARIEWARAHDAEARAIQRAGREFVERVITDAQNDCYWAAVLIEWGRLQEGGR